MAINLGDVPVGSTVDVLFSMNDAAGGAVNPSGTLEAVDFQIFKDGSATERSVTNGWTVVNSFNSVVGLAQLTIDLSDNTDAGFYAAGHRYYVTLVPDTETIDTQTVAAVLAYFTINNTTALRPTTSGRTLDVAATGEAGLDFANINGAAVLAATGIKFEGSVALDGSTYRVAAQLIVNGSAIVGASLSNAVVTIKNETGTDLVLSGTPAIAADGTISQSGTLTTPLNTNKPAHAAISIDYAAVTYSGPVFFSVPA